MPKKTALGKITKWKELIRYAFFKGSEANLEKRSGLANENSFNYMPLYKTWRLVSYAQVVALNRRIQKVNCERKMKFIRRRWKKKALESARKWKILKCERDSQMPIYFEKVPQENYKIKRKFYVTKRLWRKPINPLKN